MGVVLLCCHRGGNDNIGLVDQGCGGGGGGGSMLL